MAKESPYSSSVGKGDHDFLLCRSQTIADSDNAAIEVLQALSLREGEAGIGDRPPVYRRGIALLYLLKGEPFPASEVDLAKVRLDLDGYSAALGRHLGRLSGPGKRAGDESDRRASGEDPSQPLGLDTAPLGQWPIGSAQRESPGRPQGTNPGTPFFIPFLTGPGSFFRELKASVGPRLGLLAPGSSP